MGIAELSEAIEEVAGIIARHDEPLRAHTPLRVGGPADLWVEVRTLDALQAFTAEARAAGTRWSSLPGVTRARAALPRRRHTRQCGSLGLWSDGLSTL